MLHPARRHPSHRRIFCRPLHHPTSTRLLPSSPQHLPSFLPPSPTASLPPKSLHLPSFRSPSLSPLSPGADWMTAGSPSVEASGSGGGGGWGAAGEAVGSWAISIWLARRGRGRQQHGWRRVPGRSACGRDGEQQGQRRRRQGAAG